MLKVDSRHCQKRTSKGAIWFYVDLLHYTGTTVLQKVLKNNKGVGFFKE